MSTSGYRPSGRRAADIAADVEAAVAAGRAPAGTLLPPVRALAADLGVAAGTVATAYRLLAERGVVGGNRRAGTRVLGRPGAPERRSGGLAPPGTRDLASGNPDPARVVPLARALARVAAEVGRTDPVLYGAPPLEPVLAAALEKLFAAEGIGLGPVTVVGGALAGVEGALVAHLRPGMRVAVEDPGYPGLLDLIAALHLVVHPVAVDADGMVPDGLQGALAQGVQAVVLTPRAHNPTGAALSRARAAELSRVLAGHERVLVVEDDHAGPVAGVVWHSVAAAAPGPAVVVRSFAKSLSPDLRVAGVTGDAATVASVERRQALSGGWVSHLLQRTVAELLADPRTEVLLDQAGAAYAAARQALIEGLAAAGVAATGRSGLNVWVPVQDEAGVVAGMAERGWAVAAGSRFRLTSPPGVRVTVAALTPSEASAVAADLAAAIHGSGRTRTA